MQKRIAFGLCFIFALLTAAEAYADASSKTRNNCRWWRKQYVASTSVGCFDVLLGVPLCGDTSAGCGDVASSCGPKTCFWGQGAAWASNGPDGSVMGGLRQGFAWYGQEPTSLPDSSLRNSRGDHDLRSKVTYDDETQEVHIQIDSLTMTATPDDAFSRVDIWVYVEAEDETQEDPEPTEENTYWYGYLLSQYGHLEQIGFDDLVDNFTNNGELTSLVVRDYLKTIPFLGSESDFANLAVKIVIDGGMEGAKLQGPE